MPVGLVLRREIPVATRHAVFIGAPENSRRFRKVPVRRRRRRLPLQCGRIPRIVGGDPPAVMNAPEEIQDEGNLRKPQANRRPQDGTCASP